MSTHTPGPCKCRVASVIMNGLGQHKGYEVVFCPLHAQAPAMYKAIKRMLEAWDCRAPQAGIVALENVLAAVEGQP